MPFFWAPYFKIETNFKQMTWTCRKQIPEHILDLKMLLSVQAFAQAFASYWKSTKDAFCHWLLVIFKDTSSSTGKLWIFLAWEIDGMMSGANPRQQRIENLTPAQKLYFQTIGLRTLHEHRNCILNKCNKNCIVYNAQTKLPMYNKSKRFYICLILVVTTEIL